jgi:hypothetical protein
VSTFIVSPTRRACHVMPSRLGRSFSQRTRVFSGKGAFSDIIGEGMLIIGWVAMWRPLEIFLYEWVSIRRRLSRRRVQAIAAIAVSFIDTLEFVAAAS